MNVYGDARTADLRQANERVVKMAAHRGRKPLQEMAPQVGLEPTTPPVNSRMLE
jgi:hypothetical protein